MLEIPSYSRATQILALQRFGHVTPRLFNALFQRFETIERILLADIPALVEMEGMSRDAAKRISGVAAKLPESDKLIESYTQREISLVTRFDEEYPHLLEELNDPPSLLFVRGKLPDRGRKSATLVGAENGTAAGIELTSDVARKFAEQGVQVVSSLTGGINAAAHLAARTAGGRTFGVVESGFDQMEQLEEVALAIDIAGAGGVISEYLPETKRTPGTIGEVNRLLAGLGQAVVVTELYQDSARALDMLQFCNLIGKMAFLLIDPTKGVLLDDRAYAQARTYGALPLEGLDKVDAIVASLV